MPWATILGGCLSFIAAIGGGIADRVILSDGNEVLGQVVEPSPRGVVRVVVRRAWAAENLPERLAFWERDEAKRQERARHQRKVRLEDWARERRAATGIGPGDEILRWIEEELRSLDAPIPEASPLMVVDLDARTVHTVQRRGEPERRMLRQAWRSASIEEPESMPPDDLRRRLEGRGFAMSGVDLAPIDDLVGPLPETDDYWAARRAATEVKHNPASRFVRYEGLVLPEDQEQIDPAAVGQLARSMLQNLIGDPAAHREDPLDEPRRALEGRGASGMVVTELQIAPDFSGATVVATLWVRAAPGRWVPMIRRPAEVRSADVQPDDVAALAAAPQVGRIFGILDSLGLGDAGGAQQRLSVEVGTATRQALGMATSALWHDLEALALPIGR